MTAIAFLGLGAMGSRMAARLIENGFELTVWNRSIDRTQSLAERGAKVASSPREAARGADFVFAMVRDDEASRSVWLDPATGALDAMSNGTVAVECSTLSVSHARALAKTFDERNIAFVDAPVAGSRPQAEAGQLIFLAGGRAETLARIRPALDVMGGAAHHAGDRGAGTVLKLMVNGLFGVQLATMAELIAFARRAGIDDRTAIDIIGSTPVCSPAAKGSAAAMLEGAFAPAFPIDLVAKDFGLIAGSATTLSAELPVSDAAGKVYERGAAKGYGGDNITGIIQLYGPS
ncbi:MAG: NAD(P)-dependent oxidoreductase [Geminicoccaceae bacterium]